MNIVELVTNFLPLVRETSAWVCSAREAYVSGRAELDAIATECRTITSNLSVLLALYKTTANVGQVSDEAEIWMQMKVEITSCEDTIKSIRRKLQPYSLETDVKVKYVVVGEDDSITKLLIRLHAHHANLTTSLAVLLTHNMQRASHDTRQLRELYNNQLDTLSRVLDEQPFMYNEGADDPAASMARPRRNSDRGSDLSQESAQDLNVYVMASSPYLKHLVKDRHRVEAEKKQLQVKNDQLREDKQRLRGEKHQLEAEKQKLENKNRLLEEDKRHLENKNRLLEEDKRHLEKEKKERDEHRQKLEEDKLQLQEEKKQLQRDKRQLQEEKNLLQDEKNLLQEEKRQLQEEGRRLERGRRRFEKERRQWMSERDELKEEKELLEKEWVGERVRETINSVFDTISKL